MVRKKLYGVVIMMERGSEYGGKEEGYHQQIRIFLSMLYSVVAIHKRRTKWAILLPVITSPDIPMHTPVALPKGNGKACQGKDEIICICCQRHSLPKLKRYSSI
jgi:hypothetical protein